MKSCLMMMCFAVLAVSTAPAQQKKAVPPPPKPADQGPSLEVTMKFIQDRLSEQGRLSFEVFQHDDLTGKDEAQQYSFEMSNPIFDSAGCTYRYQGALKLVPGGGSTEWQKTAIPLKGIKSVRVMPVERWWNPELAEQGTPARSARVEPAYFVLSLGRAEKGVSCTRDGKAIECGEPTLFDQLANVAFFREEDMANRVAKAMVHAVELCGGGSKPEAF
jgi:hypothetical protein